MIELDIEGFQSIDKARVEVDGFTALVGRSNIGKSAVIRALKCALTGASGTDFVRHGPACERRLKGNKKCRCQTTVRIKTPEMLIVWQKGDSINRYEVTFPGKEPEVYDKPGAGTPEFLKPWFDPVKVGDNSSLIQVSDQFKPIFLLDESGSTVADVLSDVARLDDINTAMRMVAKDRKNAVSTRNVREKDVASLSEELKAFSGLDAAAVSAEKVEQAYTELATKQRRLEKVSGLADSWSRLAAIVKGLAGVDQVQLPDIVPMRTKAELVQQASVWLEEVRRKAPVVRSLAGVDKVKLPEAPAMQGYLDKVRDLTAWISRAVSLQTAISAAKAASKVELPEAPLKETLDQVKAAQRFQTRLVGLERATSDLEKELQATEAEATDVLGQFEQLGVCPTCTQNIEPGHLHLETS